MRFTILPKLLPALLSAGTLLAAAGQAGAVDRDLASMQDRLDALVRKVSPSIVGVQPFTPEQRLRLTLNLPRDPGESATKAAKAEYSRKIEEVFLKVNAFGSGVIIDREGHIVTTTRTVPAMIRNVTVIYHDGKTESARVVGRSPAFNIALLKVGRKDLTPAAPGGQVKLGQMVVSAGNVFDITYRMRRFAFSIGTVTGLYDIPKEAGYTTYYSGPVIETDAAVNPGIYGGPLFDLDGGLSGILTCTFSYQRFLGTAIPIDMVRKGIAEILDPSAGLSGERIGLTDLGAAVVWSGDALKVASVDKDGIADQAGLKLGDSILAIWEEPPTKENLADLVSKSATAGAFRLRIERDGWEKTFDIETRGPGDDESSGDDF